MMIPTVTLLQQQHYLLVAIIIITLPTLVLSQSCEDCVAQGCTYCLGEEFFDNDSVCVCEDFNGFFGGCDDFSFGATPLTSKWDCQFSSSNGELILGVAIAVPILICCCCSFVAYCVYKSRQQRPPSQPMNATPAYPSNTGYYSTGGTSPATTMPTAVPNTPAASVPYAYAQTTTTNAPPPATNPAYTAGAIPATNPDYDITVEPSIADQMMADLRK
jgi:hypothetical protein